MTGVDPKKYFGSVIMVVNRGGCSFASKVYNAELAGASAVVVIDF